MPNFLTATRRNHALEHATIHILTQQFPRTPLGGHSNPTGFFIVGNVPAAAVREAAAAALLRLQNGESGLAIHPGCGTNFIVTGALSGLLAILGMIGTKNTRQRLERFPLLILLTAIGAIFGQPLGLFLQKEVTTDPQVGGLTLVDVFPVAANLTRIITA
ncbi:MAG: hypothetical protein Fur0035_03240 [Anaerolineales bacterium]